MCSCGLDDFANDAPVKNQMVGEKRLHRHRSRAFYWRKCKMVRGTNIDSLPDELLLKILACLSDDPDYLYNKGRLVCRRWNSLDHPIFLTATEGRIEKSVMPYVVPISSCCNGLAVPFHDEMPMSIINPVTRQQFVLPSFPFAEDGMIPSECVIGYAADSMEYKVVLPCMTTDGDQVFLGILSVGSDKSWRHVGLEHLSVGARSLLKKALGMACTSEGFITWSNYKHGTYFTLDVETEILTVHPSPLPEACLLRSRHFYLSTGRTLSLLVVDKYTKYLVQLWEMKAESGEWRKLVGDIKLGALERWLEPFSVGPYGFLIPVGWVRYPEVLALYFRGSCACIFFNLNTQDISSIELPRRCGFYSSHVHKKSLTWIT